MHSYAMQMAPRDVVIRGVMSIYYHKSVYSRCMYRILPGARNTCPTGFGISQVGAPRECPVWLHRLYVVAACDPTFVCR